MPSLVRILPLLPDLTVTGVIDILAVAFLIYQCVKKCGIERPVGPGAVKIRQQLEELKINAREM